MAVPVFRHCISCNGESKAENFYVSNNEFHHGYLPYCKDCIKKIFNKNCKKYRSREDANYATCGEMGVPVIKSVWKQTVKDAQKRKFDPSFQLYYQKLNMTTTRHWDGFCDTNCSFTGHAEVTDLEEARRRNARELEFLYGIQTPEDYDFLIRYYELLTSDIEEFENEAQKTLFRKVCLDELELKKINEGRSKAEYGKVENRILTKLKTLKLDNFKVKNKSIEEQWFFNKINQIDKENVIDVYKNQEFFEDLNGRAKAIADMRRCFGNSLVGHRDFDISIEDIEEYNKP